MTFAKKDKSLNQYFMNEENLKFLKDGLVYMGFGTKLHDELDAKIKGQAKEFQLSVQGEYKRPTGETEKVDYKLDFRKSETTDMFFFNRYKATLLNDLDPAKEKGQMFYVDRGRGVTAKEAFNLLDGRSVNRDLLTKNNEPYNAWLKLEFSTQDKHGNFEVKKFTPGYGYDLLATLKKYPIKELDSSESLVRLTASLEKGNVQAVTFVREGREEKMHIEANPQYKSLNVYDESMKKVFQGNEKKEGREPEASKKKEEKSEKQEIEDKPEGEKKKSSRKRRIGV
jgi:hypothetical protein